MYATYFEFDKSNWSSKFLTLHKGEPFFPRLITDLLNRRGIFRAIGGTVLGESIDFSWANLQNADLRNINDVVGGRVSFVGADLRSADLRRVKAGLSEDEPWDFSHANLRNADVKDANFIYAKGLNPVQFINARNWQSARVSPEFRQMLRQSSFHALQQEQRRRAL